MHLQPVFRQCRVRGGAVAAELFDTGLCLPSGSGLSDAEQDSVIAALQAVPRRITHHAAAGVSERMMRV
jgi:dTDP-4-amino-4,6-dideoxygalactose transaminase